jgi:hypothetical protein
LVAGLDRRDLLFGMGIGRDLLRLSSISKDSGWIFVLILFVAVIFVRGKLLKLAAVFAAFALVILWWFTLKPSNDGPWPPDIAETAWAEINGDEVTINNVRNCDYRTETDFTTHWEKRTVRLSHIAGLDLAIMYWGSPYMAHPIASFRFADALPICFPSKRANALGRNIQPSAVSTANIR